MVYTSSNFKGFYCPEFIGSKTKSYHDKSDALAIAIFDSSAIKQTRTYDMPQILDALEEAEFNGNVHTCNIALHILQDYADNVYANRMNRAKEKADKEHREKLAAGYVLVDDGFYNEALDIIKRNYKNDHRYYQTMQKMAEKWFVVDRNNGTYIQKKPIDLVRAIVKRVNQHISNQYQQDRKRGIMVNPSQYVRIKDPK